jgi:hypothetical protein
LFVVGINAFCISQSNDYTKWGSKAFIISQKFVKQNLKSPKSADFPFDTYTFKYYKKVENTYVMTIKSYVDSKNSFNAEIRTHYHITMAYKGGDWTDINNWILIQLLFE